MTLEEDVNNWITKLEFHVNHGDPELYPATLDACEAALEKLKDVLKAIKIDEGPHMLTVRLDSRDKAIILANKLAKEYNLKCEIKPCQEGRE